MAGLCIFDGFNSLFNEQKRYFIVYILILTIITLSAFHSSSFSHMHIYVSVFIISSILGCVFISLYPKHIELYKLVFLMILCFGIISCFLTPINMVPDESEHLVRAEITSQGVLIPEYVNGSYLTINAVLNLINDYSNTVFTSNSANQPINFSIDSSNSAFSQNPFFGYIFQALGILLAKVLNLNTIWILWLARIMNCLLYASLISLAVKKASILKVPLTFISCLPLTLYQISSVSIDSLVFGFGILAFAYFLFMFKSENESLTKKDIFIFSFLCLILGFSKITYFAFIFLLLLVPGEKFEKKSDYYLCLFSVILVIIIALCWSIFYANPSLEYSNRHLHALNNNINQTSQLNYVINHPLSFIKSGFFSFNYLFPIDELLLCYFEEIQTSSYFLKRLFVPVFCLIMFAYPHKEKYPMKLRLGLFLISFIIFYGTYFIQLLSWTPVGQLYPIFGVQTRYFIPLLPLISIIFALNNNSQENPVVDKVIIMFSIVFMATLSIVQALVFY